MMQMSKPNDSRGVPKNRWVYKSKAHALSVLQEIYERRVITVPFMISPGKLDDFGNDAVDDRSRPWLLVVDVPAGTPLAEVLKRHNFGPSGKDHFEEVFPAYYLKQRAVVREVIELNRTDEEWIAMQVQKKLLKAAGSAG